MYGLHGIAFAQYDIGFVRNVQQCAGDKYGPGNTQARKVYRAEYFVSLDQAVCKVQENKGAAAQLQQGSVGKDIAAVISFGHTIDLIYMKLQQPQLCCINCWEAKLVGHLTYINLLE